MNLLLVEPGEIGPDGLVTLTGRRCEHLRRVLGVTIGRRVRAGVVGGRLGRAEVLADDGVTLTLRLALTEPAPAPLPIEIVLAIPRPKVLSRVVEAAASFGVLRIDLTNAWRVEKSYLGSPRLAAVNLERAARLGAEQGGTTHLTPVTVHSRLMGLLDARWPADTAEAHKPASRLLAHPAGEPIEEGELKWPLTLAIGPEGGWIEREVETFAARGFRPVTLGAPILRVEAALPAALAQLLVLRRLGSRVD